MAQDEERDLPADGSEGGLTDDMKRRLEAGLDEFEAGLRTDPSFDPLAYVRGIVGEANMRAATSHLIGLRIARMRSAAKRKGFDVGV